MPLTPDSVRRRRGEAAEMGRLYMFPVIKPRSPATASATVAAPGPVSLPPRAAALVLVFLALFVAAALLWPVRSTPAPGPGAAYGRIAAAAASPASRLGLGLAGAALHDR
jgi:hypothetical protein